MAGIPKPSNDNGNGTPRNPFLKAKHIGKGTKMLTLTGNARMQDGQFGEQIVVDVKLGKTAYAWAFSANSGNHTRLHKRFGSNPKKWKGAVKVSVREWNDNEYVAVVD